MSEQEAETTEVPEQPDADPIGEPDTEPDEPFEEPEPSAAVEQPQPVQHGRSPEDLEKMRKKLDQSAATWTRRVEELLGDDFGMLIPCELCSFDIPGFHWPAEIQTPISEQHDRLLRVLREPAAPEYRAATQVRQCGDCDGYGKVNSGSKLPQHSTVTCPACKGYGYVPPPVPGGNGVVTAPVAGIELAQEEEQEAPADADIWGSPRLLPDGQENPNYGKMPQYKIASLP